MDAQLLDLALTHRSWAYENGAVPTNERLEFLGDAVLQLVVTDFLYRTYPDFSEGRLSKLRIAVVNTHAIAQVARRLRLGPMIKLGKGEVVTGGDDKDSILADTTEAIIGAVHLDAGQQMSTQFVETLFVPLIRDALDSGAGFDHKTALQEIAAQQGVDVRYDVTGTGPDHSPEFTAYAQVGDRRFGPGVGRTKRLAEQIAARIAVETKRAEAPTTPSDGGNQPDGG